jgi:hypothetical protein
LLGAGGLAVDGGELRPGDQVRGGGNAAHLDAELGEQLLGGDHPDPTDRIQLGDLVANGPITRSISAVTWSIVAVAVSMRSSISWHRKPWWSSQWPVSASSNTASLDRMLARASRASALGLRWPAMSAWSIWRPDTRSCR